MECCIAGVFPVAGNWSEECCIAVRQLLAGKTLRVNLVETLEHSCIHAVDILFSMGRLCVVVDNWLLIGAVMEIRS